MHFELNHIYHVYNRGNNKAPIFFSPENYSYLLGKIRKEWSIFCDIYSYCLMPNHFHFIIEPNEIGCRNIILKEKESHLQNLSKAIGKTLSSYTRAINKQNHTSGTLFQKKTKAKCLTHDHLTDMEFTKIDYLHNCLFYIHNNPLSANLVNSLTEWPHSSWADYYGYRNENLCNKEKAMNRLGFNKNDFLLTVQNQPNEKIIELLW